MRASLRSFVKRWPTFQEAPVSLRFKGFRSVISSQAELDRVTLRERQSSQLKRQQEKEQQNKQQEEPGSGLRSFLRNGARVTRAAHILLSDLVNPGDFVVDATCGNGSDTLWLCRAVGPCGRVLAMDVQADAMEATTNLLEWELPKEHWPEIAIIQRCHTEMKEELGELAPKLICFNLGYLPYTDKSIMTLPKTTVTALQVALEAVDKDGAVSVISYVGHEGGQAEHDAVSELLSKLDTRDWTVINAKILNRPLAPVLFIATRK